MVTNMKSNLRVVTLTLAFMALTASAHWGTVTISNQEKCPAELGEGTFQLELTKCSGTPENICQNIDINTIDISDPDQNQQTICYTWTEQGCPGGALRTWYPNQGCQKTPETQKSIMCERCFV